jgi:hypothetical protein
VKDFPTIVINVTPVTIWSRHEDLSMHANTHVFFYILGRNSTQDGGCYLALDLSRQHLIAFSEKLICGLEKFKTAVLGLDEFKWRDMSS